MSENFIGNRITELRMLKNVSERQMSLDLGHSPSYINGIVSGKMPSVTELLYICEYLGVTPSEFFDDERQPSLLQKQAIDYIYELNDEDVKLIIGFIERVHKTEKRDVGK